MQKSINLGSVTVNGELVKSNYIVKPDDEIEIELETPDKKMYLQKTFLSI